MEIRGHHRSRAESSLTRRLDAERLGLCGAHQLPDIDLITCLLRREGQVVVGIAHVDHGKDRIGAMQDFQQESFADFSIQPIADHIIRRDLAIEDDVVFPSENPIGLQPSCADDRDGEPTTATTATPHAVMAMRILYISLPQNT
jgi:hypothetical protein